MELKVLPSGGEVLLNVSAAALGISESDAFPLSTLTQWRIRDLKAFVAPILKVSFPSFIALYCFL